jgi:synaptosomal-associated protein 29
MSGHNYFSNNGNLFSDVDDDEFLRNTRVESRGSNNNNDNEYLEQRKILEMKRKEIEERTLNSSVRSVGLLHETEKVGTATAEELARQREQLEKTKRQLDDINTTLRFSQKHLNGLKSVFGGLKNYLSGNNDVPRMSNSPSGSNLGNTSEPLSPTAEDRYLNHPTTRLRNDPPETQKFTGSFNEQLDRNLDEMANSLGRLKGLAIDLHGEIGDQNDLIDDITESTENTDIKIQKQNKQMFGILGKK